MATDGVPREAPVDADWEPPPGPAPVLGCLLGGGLTFLAWMAVLVIAFGEANGEFSSPRWVVLSALWLVVVADVVGLHGLVLRSAAVRRRDGKLGAGLVVAWTSWGLLTALYLWIALSISG